MAKLFTLRTLRSIQGLTQEDLARLMGLHVNTIIRWEGGQGSPSPSQIERMARILRVMPGHVVASLSLDEETA